MGVVFAPTSPDRGPDMIAWAEGGAAILRNGAPVTHDLTDADLARAQSCCLTTPAACVR